MKKGQTQKSWIPAFVGMTTKTRRGDGFVFANSTRGAHVRGPLRKQGGDNRAQGTHGCVPFRDAAFAPPRGRPQIFSTSTR